MTFPGVFTVCMSKEDSYWPNSLASVRGIFLSFWTWNFLWNKNVVSHMNYIMFHDFRSLDLPKIKIKINKNKIVKIYVCHCQDSFLLFVHFPYSPYLIGNTTVIRDFF